MVADLTGAKLRGADLEWADLREASGLTREQIVSAKHWKTALYDVEWFQVLGFLPDHNVKLEEEIAGWRARGQPKPAPAGARSPDSN
jgi:hypothetical protein